MLSYLAYATVCRSLIDARTVAELLQDYITETNAAYFSFYYYYFSTLQAMALTLRYEVNNEGATYLIFNLGLPLIGFRSVGRAVNTITALWQAL